LADIESTSWQEVDASNNSASPNGWASGTMIPSQVEPTARAMMGALKRDWDHKGATVTSGGSANVHTLTYSVAPAAYVAGQVFAFKSGFTNTGSATVNVNALGAKTIVYNNGAALLGGEIQAGDVIVVYYDGTNMILGNPRGILTPIATTLASTSATIDFTGLTSAFTKYTVLIHDLVPATDNVYLQMRVGTGGGPTWQSGASAYSYGYRLQGPTNGGDGGSGADADGTSIHLTRPSNGISSSGGLLAEITIANPSGASLNKLINYVVGYNQTAAAGVAHITGSAFFGSATAVTAIRFLVSSGNITSGTFQLLGVR
jgi:hypothetical protein